MNLTGLDPQDLYQLRHLANPDTLTVPGADGTELAITATDTPMYWRVRDVGPVTISLAEMIFNWRLTLSRKEDAYWLTGAWCYFGRNWQDFERAVRAAYNFDPTTQDAPEGFNKEVLSWSATSLKGSR